jgi:hypothetical protein
MWAALLLIVSSAGSTTSFASDSAYGAFGPEGARLREQLWVLPGGDPDFALRFFVLTIS